MPDGCFRAADPGGDGLLGDADHRRRPGEGARLGDMVQDLEGVEIEVHAQTVTLDQNSYHVTETADEEVEEDDVDALEALEAEAASGDKTDDDDVEVTITDEDVYGGLLNRDEKSDDNKTN